MEEPSSWTRSLSGNLSPHLLESTLKSVERLQTMAGKQVAMCVDVGNLLNGKTKGMHVPAGPV